MKIKISYQMNELTEAAEIYHAVKEILPHARLHINEDKPPYCIVYLTSKNPSNSQNDGKST